jgi:hypothetical protein
VKLRSKAKAPRTNVCGFRSLPSGSYVVKAVLFGADGRQRALVEQEINIMSSGPGQ